ncbi:NACHT domain-containing protein [Anatilimnocola floriformis]|uniref:NACHT domain-containing protein n=1 Tax=Anatilimnocola floriformis TaxID=2948575 RepID=UPI0020C42B08|nr:hypothetical protein [Anatilimnocola floriformis]
MSQLPASLLAAAGLIQAPNAGWNSDVFFQAWLRGPCWILTDARNRKLNEGEQKALSKLLEVDIKRQLAHAWTQSRLGSEPELEQFAAYVRALTNSTLAAHEGHDWSPQRAVAPPAKMLEYGAAALDAFSQFWAFCRTVLIESRLGRDPVGDPAGHTKSFHAVDAIFQGVRGQFPVTLGSWLMLRRTLNYLWERQDMPSAGSSRSVSATDLPKEICFLGDTRNGGQVGKLRAACTLETGGAYLDPVDSGFVAFDDDMTSSLNLAWRTCRGSMESQRPKTEADRLTLRLTLVDKRAIALKGKSAGGMFALGMIAAAKRVTPDKDCTGTFSLQLTNSGGDDGESPLTINDIGVGPVDGESLLGKTQAAVNAQLTRIMHFAGQTDPFSALNATHYEQPPVFLPITSLYDAWQNITTENRKPPPASLLPYLRSLMRTYGRLKLEGIREAESLEIDLERVYIALKADPDTNYDMQNEAEVHAVEVQEQAGVSSVSEVDPGLLDQIESGNIRRKIRPKKEAAKRAAVKEVRTLGDVFRQYRRVVMLGGPGSGKSTLGHWLALQFARSFQKQVNQRKPQFVQVPLAKLEPDPTLVKDSNATVNLGPARLPIFLRIAHYAKELARREKQELPEKQLIEYLGYDKDSEALNDNCTADERNALFKTYIKSKQAVIFLDGLDELPEGNRHLVLRKVQEFIHDHVDESSSDESQFPANAGGNQVIVTSRYVGYKARPLRASCAHFNILDMQRPAVEQFAKLWTDAVNPRLLEGEGPGIVADDLIAEIYNDQRPAVRELATTPLLVTILAIVFWKDRHLPDQRAGLYARVVDNLIEIWRKRPPCQEYQLESDELYAALEPLAAKMQADVTNNGFVGLQEIGEIIDLPLTMFRGEQRSRSVRKGMLSTIGNHVGLLVEAGPDNYKFYHRQFQEFLAARHLLANKKTAAGEVIQRLDDPIWREPLLLALGFVMLDELWGAKERSALLRAILSADGPDALIPQAALLVVAAFPDMRDLPAEIVRQTAIQLLTSYANSLNQQHAGAALREQIERAFSVLRAGAHAQTVARTIAESIGDKTAPKSLAPAAATLLMHFGWFTPDQIRSLLSAVHEDRRTHDFPVHRALLMALCDRPTAFPWLEPREAISSGTFASELPMRNFLEGHPDIVDHIQGDNDWLWLMIALYGGLGHVQLLDRLKASQQQKLRNAIADETIQSGELAAVSEIPAIEIPIGPWLAFSPRDIVHDLADKELSHQIQTLLSAKTKNARDLIPILKKKWDGAQPPLKLAECAEALVGLAALGEDVLPRLLDAAKRSDSDAMVRSALDRFAWLNRFLQEPLVRSAETILRTIPERAAESHQLDLLAVAQEILLASGCPPLKISDRCAGQRFVAAASPAARATLDAEHWSYLFSGVTSDADVACQCAQMSQPVEAMIEALSQIGTARNHLAQHRMASFQTILQPRARNLVDQFLALLDSVAEAPKELQFLAGAALGHCRKFVKKTPDLAWETLLVIAGQGPDFLAGYRSTFSRSKARSWVEQPTAFLKKRGRRLWKHIENIKNPFLRFRAEWRFEYLSDSLPGEAKFLNAILGRGIRDREIDLLKDQIVSSVTIRLARITNPHEKLLALERVLTTFPSLFPNFWSNVRSAADKIDPENRARTLCRLALCAGDQEALLRDAIEAIYLIPEEDRQAETIREVRLLWGSLPGIHDELDKLSAVIPDVWLKNKSQLRNSRLVQTYRRAFDEGALVWRLPHSAPGSNGVLRHAYPNGSLPWGLIYLSATAREIESTVTAQAGGHGDWSELLGDEWQTALAGLVAGGMERGIRIGAREAGVIDQLHRNERGTRIDSLWQHLDQPDLVPAIARWEGRSDRPGQWLALVQMEGGRITAKNVSLVVDLLETSTDRLQLRAAIALHGQTPSVQNTNRRWSVRRVGGDAIDAAARGATTRGLRPAASSALDWIAHDIHHDDSSALARWLEVAATASQPDTPELWILKKMESIESDLVPTLLTALRSGTTPFKQALLRGLCRIAHCSRKSLTPHRDLIRSVIQSVPEYERSAICDFPGGPQALLETAQAAVRASKGPSRLQFVTRMFQKSTVSLRNVDDNVEQTMVQVGGELLVDVLSYWKNARESASLVNDVDEVLALLLSWLQAERSNPGQVDFLHHLLTAIDSLARLHPLAFAKFAEPPETWELILAEYAESAPHWAARTAAISLLGRLRRVTSRVARALHSTMNDVIYVQDAANEAVLEFRCAEGNFVPDLLQLLGDPSAGVKSAAVRLLVNIARAEGSFADRKQILNGLKSAAVGVVVPNPVYRMFETSADGAFNIRYLDQLDRLLIGGIFELYGM